jgi:hypothetical protein
MSCRTIRIALGLMPRALRRSHKCPVIPRSCLPSIPRALDALGNRENWYVHGCVWCGARLTSHVHGTHQANRDSVKKGNNIFANHLSTSERDSFFFHKSSRLVPPHSFSHDEESKPYWAHQEGNIVASKLTVQNGSFLRPLGETRASSSFLHSGPRASLEKRATSVKRSHLVPDQRPRKLLSRCKAKPKADWVCHHCGKHYRGTSTLSIKNHKLSHA